MNLSLTRMFVHEPMERGDVLWKDNEVEKKKYFTVWLQKKLKKIIYRCVINVIKQVMQLQSKIYP